MSFSAATIIRLLLISFTVTLSLVLRVTSETSTEPEQSANGALLAAVRLSDGAHSAPSGAGVIHKSVTQQTGEFPTKVGNQWERTLSDPEQATVRPVPPQHLPTLQLPSLRGRKESRNTISAP